MGMGSQEEGRIMESVGTLQKGEKQKESTSWGGRLFLLCVRDAYIQSIYVADLRLEYTPLRGIAVARDVSLLPGSGFDSPAGLQFWKFEPYLSNHYVRALLLEYKIDMLRI